MVLQHIAQFERGEGRKAHDHAVCRAALQRFVGFGDVHRQGRAFVALCDLDRGR